MLYDVLFRPMQHFAACMIACMTLLFGHAFLADAQVTLVTDSQPKAVLVVAADQPQALKAGQIIQRYVEEMSGAKLPLITEGQAVPPGMTSHLWIGHTAQAKKLGIELPQGYDPSIRANVFDEEGLRIKTVDHDLVLGGNQDGPYKGTIYAAYRLLESLGCRWYMPGNWARVIPQKKTLVVETMDVLSKPDFTVRNILVSAWIPMSTEEYAQYDEWAEKVGFTETLMYPLVGDGFLGFLLPAREYMAEHPEYFALDKEGKRSNSDERWTMLCLANPAVLEQSIANLKEAFAGKRSMPNVRPIGFGISPPDGAVRCYSKEFPMVFYNFNYPQYIHEPMVSESFFGFAQKLAEAFPDKWVSTMAYADREMPVQGIELPDNIMVMYAPISSDVLHDNNTTLWRRQETVSILRQWLKQTPHLVIYDYNPGLLTGMFVPERDAANMAVNVPMYKKMGVKGMWREGRKAFMQTWISYYVTGKLLWDANADVNAIKDEFYTNLFGESAGKHVRAWWDACEKQLSDSHMQAHEDFLINHLYTSAFAASLEPHLQQARVAAQISSTPEQIKRLDVMDMIADHFMTVTKMYDAEADMNWPEAAKMGRRAFDLKVALNQADNFLIDVDPKVFRIYFAEGRAKYFETLAKQTDGTEGTLIANLPRMMDYTRDPFNEGVVGEWYLPEHDITGWEQRDSYYLLEQQEPPISPRGHAYEGYVWYRTKVNIPVGAQGKPVRLRMGGVINEGWIWVNGKFVGHKKNDLWWSHANQFEVDVTSALKPGVENTIAIRVLIHSELGGLFRRGLLWSPNPAPPTP